jgi:hypothetical protein
VGGRLQEYPVDRVFTLFPLWGLRSNKPFIDNGMVLRYRI